MFELDLTPFGAEGFTLSDRLDMSGHNRTEPHINADLVNPSDRILRREAPHADFRDLIHNQLPGFNGMRDS